LIPPQHCALVHTTGPSQSAWTGLCVDLGQEVCWECSKCTGCWWAHIQPSACSE